MTPTMKLITNFVFILGWCLSSTVIAYAAASDGIHQQRQQPRATALESWDNNASVYYHLPRQSNNYQITSHNIALSFIGDSSSLPPELSEYARGHILQSLSEILTNYLSDDIAFLGASYIEEDDYYSSSRPQSSYTLKFQIRTRYLPFSGELLTEASVRNYILETLRGHTSEFLNYMRSSAVPEYNEIYEVTADVYVPTSFPTHMPTFRPTRRPTKRPTKRPSPKPIRRPSPTPTRSPSKNPTARPTKKPTKRPTNAPTDRPSYLIAIELPRPTNAPTKRPTNRPISTPTMRTHSTHQIQLNFDDVTSAITFSLGVQLDLIELIKEELTNGLKSHDMEVRSVELIDAATGRNMRRLAELKLPAEITVHHPVSLTKADAYDIIIKALEENFDDVFGEYIRSTPGNRGYYYEQYDNQDGGASFHGGVTDYVPASSGPSKEDGIASANGRTNKSFPVALIFTGVSSFHALSEESKVYVCNRIRDTLNKKMDPDIELVNVSSEKDEKRRHLAEEEDDGDWIHMPILITVNHPSNREDVLDHILDILRTNIWNDIMPYLRDREDFFDETTNIHIQAGPQDNEPPQDNMSLNSVMNDLNQTASTLPWWVWMLIGFGILFLCWFLFACCAFCARRRRKRKNKKVEKKVQFVNNYIDLRRPASHRPPLVKRGNRETRSLSPPLPILKKRTKRRVQYPPNKEIITTPHRQIPPSLEFPTQNHHPMDFPPSIEPYLMLPPSEDPPEENYQLIIRPDIQKAIVAADHNARINAGIEPEGIIIKDSSEPHLALIDYYEGKEEEPKNNSNPYNAPDPEEVTEKNNAVVVYSYPKGYLSKKIFRR